jgi:probable O-glycosylation ligase (exosortase A-associated)
MNATTATQGQSYAQFRIRQGTSTWLYVGLLIFFLFLYLRPQDLIPGLDNIRPVFIFMTLLSLAFLVSNTRGALHEDSPFFKGLLVFSATIIWSVPFSFYRGASFDAMLDFFKVVLTCYLIIKIADSFQRIERIILLINTVLVLFAVDITLKYLAGQDHGTIHGLVAAQFANPNDLSVNFVLFLPMLFYYSHVCKNMLLKLFWFGLFAVILFGVVGCQSRGGMLGAVLILVLLFLKSERKMLALLAGAVVTVLVLLFARGDAFDRLNTVINYKEESSAYSRVLFYESSIQMLLDRPLTGVGINAWPTAYAEAFRNNEDLSYRWPDPHSTYNQIIGELGVPGVIAYSFLLYATFRSLRRTEKFFKQHEGFERQLYFVQCLRIGLLGFAFTVMFQSFTYYHTLYNLMALVVAMERSIPGGLSESAVAAKGA